MITDSQYEHWLNQSAADRVVLVELHHADGIEYIADQPYISLPTDSLANQPFNDLLIAVSDVSSRIDGITELADIELINDGSLAGWKALHWRGFPVVMRLGDVSWSYDDFRIMARQINDGLLSYNHQQLTFGIYDQTALLDKPVERPEMPGGQVVPLVLGQVTGALATQISTQSLLYQFSWLPVTSLTVRDGNGPEMNHVADLEHGQFTLSAYTPRNVICDVTESHTTALSIIDWVAALYAIPLASTIELPDYTLGLRYDSEVTGRQILDDVCRALGASWRITLSGELFVQRYALPDPQQPVDVNIFADDIESEQIELVQTDEPFKSLTVNYARNYSPMSEVAGVINDTDPELAERLRAEWRVSKAEQGLTDYPLAPDHIIDTALTSEHDATTERDRRLAIRNQRRDTWSITAFITTTKAVVGASVEVHHPELSGRIGRIVSTRLSPADDRIELEVRY